jgi:hypothetical protein
MVQVAGDRTDVVSGPDLDGVRDRDRPRIYARDRMIVDTTADFDAFQRRPRQI